MKCVASFQELVQQGKEGVRSINERLAASLKSRKISLNLDQRVWFELKKEDHMCIRECGRPVTIINGRLHHHLSSCHFSLSWSCIYSPWQLPHELFISFLDILCLFSLCLVAAAVT